MKPFYQSKTLWFNLLFLISAVAAYFGFGDFQPSGDTVEMASVIVAVINIALRFVTDKTLTAS